MIFFILYTFCASQNTKLNNIEEYCQGLVKNINDNIAKHKKESSNCISCYAIVRKNKENETQNTIDLAKEIIKKYMSSALNNSIRCHIPTNEILIIKTTNEMLKEMFGVSKSNTSIKLSYIQKPEDIDTEFSNLKTAKNNQILLFENCFESKLDKLILYERIKPVIGQIDNKNYQHVFLCLRFDNVSECDNFNEDIKIWSFGFMTSKDKELDFYVLNYIGYNYINAEHLAEIMCGEKLCYEEQSTCSDEINKEITYKNYYTKKLTYNKDLSFYVAFNQINEKSCEKLFKDDIIYYSANLPSFYLVITVGNETKEYYFLFTCEQHNSNTENTKLVIHFAVIEYKQTKS
ncbi:hypothetical protein BDAP_002886 [Binucleata daphniae]